MTLSAQAGYHRNLRREWLVLSLLAGAADELKQALLVNPHDLDGVADAIALSRATLAKIRQNLFFAFIYNVLGIPLAAAGMLNPVFAGAAKQPARKGNPWLARAVAELESEGLDFLAPQIGQDVADDLTAALRKRGLHVRQK